jgi:subtilisin-like proprotein convertase family protein
MRVKKFVALLVSATLGFGLSGIAAAPSASAAVFSLSNTTAITLPCGGAGLCNASPFPSDITQFGLSTVVTDVNVTLLNVSHLFPGDFDIELIGPNGAVVALMSDSCGGTDIVGRNLTFDDAAAGSVPAVSDPACNTSATYKPSNVDDASPEQWGAAPTATTLAAFNGINPNGSWQLSLGDDANGDTGDIAGGWSIQITTASTAPITMPAFGSNGAGVAAPYPVPIAVSGVSGLITDVNLTIPGLAHTSPADLQVMLQSPSGATVKLLSGNCGDTDVLNQNFVFDDAAAATLPAACAAGGTFKPTANALAAMPAPAPAGPFGTTMAAFNGASANGTWKLYINDTQAVDGGWISATPTLTFTTTATIPPDTIPPDTKFTKKPKTGFKTTTIMKFVSTEAGSHFECKIDSKKFKPCKSPLKLKNLKLGKHKIQIRAIDGAGNVDPTPLRGKWKIIKKS